MPRLYCPAPLTEGELLDLPPGAARHAQVLRLQPGSTITLFGGLPGGGEFEAEVTRMGRSEVQVRLGAHRPIERETAHAVHLLVGMPANDRMDWLVEKATELGMASLQPLLGERSVLKLSGERALKRQAHWQAIAVAACEQSGRNRVPRVHEPLRFEEWARRSAQDQELDGAARKLLSLRPGARPLRDSLAPAGATLFMSGPEGGWTPGEEDAAMAQGFTPVSLGARVLRAETAPLAVLAAFSVLT
ncbi:MAG: 16S rRNA (uracil(1498)-N(3))-methyltransferase [Burkholderiaceae bacterium]|nr:16S rRNA (uracil(1498)-N(3))-methyltransferase [Burkholderiaceae bacterium]MDO9088570.1 16S rRNA (uracil(1498)-N(3))-methyltransferase [Burkholderiaceae bacterium]